MALIDALMEAEVQLDWGMSPNEVARALDHLKACAPDSYLIRPLQLKLVELRLAEELRRA